jgi:hypothetical protein
MIKVITLDGYTGFVRKEDWAKNLEDTVYVYETQKCDIAPWPYVLGSLKLADNQ